MSENHYDVVIVGARCAGATLATFLARAGVSVLLLDKDTLPSEHVLSTHSINPLGMDVLDEIGVGDAVRAEAPPSRLFRLNVDGQSLDLEFTEERPTYCPRRDRLDHLLQNAARRAGARLVDRARMVSLLERGGRVRGVRVMTREGERVFTAGLIVGADGRHSTVATCARAREYLGYDAERAVFWGYWDAPDAWRDDPRYAFHVYASLDADVLRMIFQTDRNQLLIASSPPLDRVGPWRTNPREALERSLRRDPMIAALIDGRGPAGKIRGTVNERFFFREAAGPGWALVGDAGHHKEFLLGDGITEALLQARTLAWAIGAGSDAALERWWHERDVEAIPLYYLGRALSGARPPRHLQRLLFGHLAKMPNLKNYMAAVAERQVSSFEALPPSTVLPWIVGGVLRGNWAVLPELLEIGRHAWAASRELSSARKQLARTVAAAGAEKRTIEAASVKAA